MADRNVISTGVGMRFAAVFLLDEDDGGIAVPSGQAVDDGWGGYTVSGVEALTLSMPEAQRIAARGDDAVFYTFTLPPTESLTGSLRVAKDDLDVQAALSGVERFGSSPWPRVLLGSDQQGYEPSIIIHGQQRAINADKSSPYFGQTVWRNYFLLNATGQLQPAGMEDQQVTTVQYSLACNQSTRTIFIEEIDDTTHGCQAAAMMKMITLGRLRLNAFVGDGTTTDFVLSTTETLRSSGTFEVWVNGVQDATATLDEATKTISFTSAPAADAKIIVAFELA